MIWLSWRQSRLELIFGLVLLAGISAFLIPTGLQKMSLFDDSGLAAALSSGSADTADLAQSFLRSYDSLNAIVAYSTLIVVIMGVALAAPIVLDFERGTHRLVWTQSITRRRWLATRLGIALLGVLVFSLVLTLMLTWWFLPQDKVQDPFGQAFNAKGVVPFAYAVFTLALALVLGALTRRTVLAAIVAIVVFVPVWGVVQDVLRPHYVAPIERTTALSEGLPTVPERAWVLDDYLIDKEGKRLTKQQLPNELSRSEVQGLRSVVVYQPADRFWTFQAIEAAIFLGAAALLLALSFWVVERRMR